MSTCLWHRVFENEAGGEGGGGFAGWVVVQEWPYFLVFIGRYEYGICADLRDGTAALFPYASCFRTNSHKMAESACRW